jgi:hypothetical protein
MGGDSKTEPHRVAGVSLGTRASSAGHQVSLTKQRCLPYRADFPLTVLDWRTPPLTPNLGQSRCRYVS